MHWLSMGRRWHRRPVDPHTDRSLYSVDEVITRRPIKWDEINFPDKWILNNAVSQRQVAEEVTNSDYSHITQNPDGKVCIEFADNSSIFSRRSFSGYRRLPEIQHISPISHEGPSYGSARRRPLSLHTLSDIMSE